MVTTGTVIAVPPGLTAEGLLGRRYMARFIDSIALAILAGTVMALRRAMPFAALLLFPAVWFG